MSMILVYINIVLYATCYQIQRPLEPYMVAKIGLNGDSSTEYANLQSFFQLMQTFGSLIAGWFLDRFGAKWGFIISFVASALSYMLLSQATTLELLYLSKVPTIFQQGFLCAQLAASQGTKDGAERVQALGRLTMSYTIGSVLGPAIGGWLGSSGDYYFGAKLAVGGSLASVLLTVLFMPTPSSSSSSSSSLSSTPARSSGYTTISTTDDDTAKVDNVIPKSTSGIPSAVQQVLLSTISVIQVVWLLLSTKVITSVANAMSQAAFPLILKDIYGLNEQAMGLSMSAMSGFNGVVNGLLLGPIVTFLGGKLTTVISVCVVSMSMISFLLAVVSLPTITALSPYGGIIEFLGLQFVLSMFQYTLSTTITSESTTRVKPTEKGHIFAINFYTLCTLLGLEHTLFAAARVIAPQIGISLLKSGGVSAVAIACGCVFMFVYGIWLTFKSTFRTTDNGEEEQELIKMPISSSLCDGGGDKSTERKEK